MALALSTIVWLLVGVIGSYIGWRYVDNREYDLTVLPLFLCSMGGIVTLIMAVAVVICTCAVYGKFSNMVVLKRSEK
jgi:hypothetical protein